MKVILAKSAGFCEGVSRAVAMTEEALRDGELYSLGELIHNRDAVERLAAQGLRVADGVEAVPDGARVVIRSHGVSKRELARLREKGCGIVDATCPRVSRIHKIVERAGAEGRPVVVFGEPEHPEVRGICGWGKTAFVTPDLDGFLRWADECRLPSDARFFVVFQTTSNKETSEQIVNFLKKEYTNAKFFDTICDATSIRQAEAGELSAACGAMVVVGGAHSANSLHLAEICRRSCGRVQFIQHADELSLPELAAADTVGVTAGASTPSWIIKEVVNKMNETDILSDETMETPVEAPVEEVPAEAAAPVEEAAPAEAAAPAEKGEMTFDELLEESIKTIYNGDNVRIVTMAIC